MKKRSTAVKIFMWFFSSIVFLALLGYAAFNLSPWPMALIIRNNFNRGGEQTNEKLAKYVPLGISSRTDVQYIRDDDDAFLDVHYQTELDKTGKILPVIVWVHGGGWVAGSKEHTSNYCKILAGKGYIVASINYSVAPGKNYPAPLRQLDAALLYLKKNGARLHIDTTQFILAGDSGGAHIVSQGANIIYLPAFASEIGIVPSLRKQELIGVILFCGPYDMGLADLDGPFGGFLSTVLWSYTGTKNFAESPEFKTISIINYITKDYPPVFISAGNGDPLLEHSYAFARKISGLGVYTDSLFFPTNYTPPLPHEYQFEVNTEAGKIALERELKFLEGIVKTP